VPLKVFATVCEVATVPVPPEPVQPEKTNDPFVPVLLADVVNSTITEEAPPLFILVKITETLLKLAAAAVCIPSKPTPTKVSAVTTATNLARVYLKKLLISRSISTNKIKVN
jgi:hypothetical protein